MGTVRNISTANGGGGPRPGQRWGNWRYYGRPPRLVWRGDTTPQTLLEIPLAPCNSRTRAMGWILHVAGKRWITAEDIGHLVRALRMLNGWEGW